MNYSFWLFALLLALLCSCGPRTSPYDQGPIGPKDPIFLYPDQRLSAPYPLMKTEETPIQRELTKEQKAAPPEIAPARKIIPGQYPGETYGSAAGQTSESQPLEAHSSSLYWQNYYENKTS